MTKEQITPFAWVITYGHQETIITFKDNTQWIGYFQCDNENPADNDKNFWNFIKNADGGRSNHFNGDDLISIETRIKSKG